MINISLVIAFDATDPNSKPKTDETVDISAFVLDLLRTRVSNLKVIEQDDYSLIVTGDVDIPNPTYIKE